MPRSAPLVWTAVAGLIALAPRGTLAADLQGAAAHFLHGRYSEAEAEYRGLSASGAGGQRGTALLGLAQVQLRTGRAAEAAATAGRAAAIAPALADDAQVLAAEGLRRLGREVEVQRKLEGLLMRNPRHLRARILLARSLRATGQHDRAQAWFDKFYDDFNAGGIDKTSAAALTCVAVACRALGGFQDANDTFREAVRADPSYLEANLEWARLFLEKYSAGHAEQSIAEVLKLDPRHPDAHALMARVKLEQGYDVRAAQKEIEAALAVDARHPEARLLRAELRLDNEEYAAAQADAAAVLAENPLSLPARSLLAAAAFLTDDRAGFEAEKRKALAQDGRYGTLLHVVAEFAVKQHRYTEAIALEEEAVKLEPRNFAALSSLAQNYLRLGEEARGLALLKQAFDGDGFNVRTFNLLNLYEDVIPKDYEFVDSPHFRLRLPKAQAKLLSRYVPRLLEDGFATFSRKYGFSPRTPIVVELYADEQHYSVRTVGLPNLGALGVTFGQVITAIAPGGGQFNWGMVLWHELAHVFAIQLSGSRVPRWLTEGLSEMETQARRREWSRHSFRELAMAERLGKLRSLSQLNAGFTRAGSIEEVVVTYHQCALVIESLAARYGLSRLAAALRRFAAGEKATSVLRQALGRDLSLLDREVAEDLHRRLAPYLRSWDLDPAEFEDGEELRKTASARPKDAAAQAALALHHLAAGEADAARPLVERALALDASCKQALFAASLLARMRKDPAAEKQLLLRLIAAGGDGYGNRSRLAQLAEDARDPASAALEWKRARDFDPDQAAPHRALAKLARAAGREDEALAELGALAYLEPQGDEVVLALVEKHAGRKEWAKVVEFGEMALYRNLLDPALHERLGRAYLANGRPGDALFELDSALLCAPRRAAPIHALRAAALLANGERAAARAALDEALRLEPALPEAQELRQRLQQP